MNSRNDGEPPNPVFIRALGTLEIWAHVTEFFVRDTSSSDVYPFNDLGTATAFCLTTYARIINNRNLLFIETKEG